MSGANVTKRVFANTMKALMIKRPFAKISVGDICEACNLNRKSFYYHFKDKYDLVTWIFQSEFIDTAQQRVYDDGWDFLKSLCVYFHKNRAFYINALKVKGQNSFEEYFHDVLSPVMIAYLDYAIQNNEYSAFFVNIFVDALIVGIEKWLEEAPFMPPEAFVGMLKQSLMSISKRP
ncbi:MAG: TetR/AcrR family transcriptional regulator C-terminal domain-containing protein [Clostridia bacterium]|nr:TetR/AcrR family transcriptional regulator C-terminal domain-containing protein [Clostridia bacterium]